MRVVIIGGVAGGMSAATRLRRLDETAEIIVLERSGHVSYANCGLPYYVGGVIAEEDKLYLQTPESLHKRFRLDVRVHHEVTEIESNKKVVIARDLISGREAEISYDKLILSHFDANETAADYDRTGWLCFNCVIYTQYILYRTKR